MTNNKQSETSSYTLGIIGVRGYVGKELLAMVARHPAIKIEWVSSRQLNGQSIMELFDTKDFNKKLKPSKINQHFEDLFIEELSPMQAALKNTNIVVLALPNGLADPFVKALESSSKTQVIVDLSADYRFHEDWFYSIPEIGNLKSELASIKRQTDSLIKISNPGCYATAMQLAIAPVSQLIKGRVHCFGVSGYSGAGTKPSANNNRENLKNSLLPYGLVEHLHEKEVTFQLNMPIAFTPHVAEFFRGINMTVQMELKESSSTEELSSLYKNYYKESALVSYQNEIPTISRVVNTAQAIIGGTDLTTSKKRAAVICCLDNLLKGAASQALQNINIALNFDSEYSVSDNLLLSGETL